jgi:hypothetical protein
MIDCDACSSRLELMIANPATRSPSRRSTSAAAMSFKTGVRHMRRGFLPETSSGASVDADIQQMTVTIECANLP